MNKSIFSQNMKKARMIKGWSQDGAALAIGISRDRLSDFENDRSEPDLETFTSIANEYNIYDLYRFINDERYFQEAPTINEVVRKYISLDERMKQAVNIILGMSA
jgi:transcriptional regulator with XRE-family HTH domain